MSYGHKHAAPGHKNRLLAGTALACIVAGSMAGASGLVAAPAAAQEIQSGGGAGPDDGCCSGKGGAGGLAGGGGGSGGSMFSIDGGGGAAGPSPGSMPRPVATVMMMELIPAAPVGSRVVSMI